MDTPKIVQTRGLRGPVVYLALLLIAAMALSVTGATAADRPKVITLPDDFQPEGIAQHANTFYVGSIPTGAIVRGDLRTGEVSPFVPAQEGRNSIGLSLRNDMLFVAGGSTGQAYVYDATTGAELAMFQLVTGSTFVNDVVATEEAAYFTDSVNPTLYKVPIEDDGLIGAPQAIPLTGDLVYMDGFNTNGIDATSNGQTLVVVQSNTGGLFTVDPQTGVTTTIDLGGETVTNGDGILLDGGRRLWVLQNRDNLLTLVRLAPDLGSGEITGSFTDETFDVPTTLARAGNRLAMVNARFGTDAPDPVEYWVTQIRRPR